MKYISIVIPAHNEEKRIARTLEEYGKFFKELKKKKILNFEIIVVLNACSDNTLEVVKNVKEKFNEIKILDFKEPGKGFAIVEGFKDALERKSEFIGFVDADMATPANSFYDLINKIENYDATIANRWSKKSIIKTKQPITRRIMSRGFNFLIKSILFLKFEDTQCGAKLFKREAIKSIINEIGTTKWAFDIDLLYRLQRKGFKIKEIPTIWEDIRGSKLSTIKVPFQMFSSIIRLRLIFSPFRFIVNAYNLLPENIKINNW